MKSTEERYFAIGDIHGEYGHYEALINKLMAEAGFVWGVDNIVFLGDKNDRGPDTFKVFEDIYRQQRLHPEQVICLLGNHERMLIDAAKGTSNLMYYNGGNQTLKSYVSATAIYGGKHRLSDMLAKAGHWDFLREHLLFLETDKYFFSHAPIPTTKYLMQNDQGYAYGKDFRTDEHVLTWTYFREPSSDWVDRNLEGMGKIAVSGHIHDLKYDLVTGKVKNPGPRHYGNSWLIDTGCGCAKEGYLTALELPAEKIYKSI